MRIILILFIILFPIPDCFSQKKISKKRLLEDFDYAVHELRLQHQGDIVRETGGLIWLNSIYHVDLNTNTYETGFNTDLHEIAKQITDNHDSNYKQ